LSTSVVGQQVRDAPAASASEKSKLSEGAHEGPDGVKLASADGSYGRAPQASRWLQSGIVAIACNSFPAGVYSNHRNFSAFGWFSDRLKIL
jgi:hypothetical protein